MTNKQLLIAIVFALIASSLFLSNRRTSVAAQSSSHDPTWWSKYEFIRDNGGDVSPLSTASTSVGGNVDVSNECGPQSETFIAINQSKPKVLAAGSKNFPSAHAGVLHDKRRREVGGGRSAPAARP